MKTIAMVVVVLIIGAILGYGIFLIMPPPPPVPKIEEVRIGVILPLTGSLAYFGQNSKLGHELAVDEINKAGGIKALGGIPISMIFADSQGNPEIGRSETERLIEMYNPHLLMGSYQSGVTLTCTEASERAGVPFFVPSAIADEITERGFKYVFRNQAKASMWGASSIRYLLEISNKRGVPIETIAFVYEDSIFGVSTGNGGKRAAEEAGLKIVLDESYPADIKDVSPLVSKLKIAKPDVVFLSSYLTDSILIAKAFHELDFNAKAFLGAGGSGYCAPDFIAAVGKDGEFFVQTVIFTPINPSPENQHFVKEFRERYGVEPTEGAGEGYIGVYTVKEVLELTGQLYPDKPLDPDSIRGAALKVDITSGPATMYPSGRIKFSEETGDNLYPDVFIVQVINGTIQIVWPFERASAEAVFPIPTWEERP